MNTERTYLEKANRVKAKMQTICLDEYSLIIKKHDSPV